MFMRVGYYESLIMTSTEHKWIAPMPTGHKLSTLHHTSLCHSLALLTLFLCMVLPSLALAEEKVSTTDLEEKKQQEKMSNEEGRFLLVEEFTAYTLSEGEFKLGVEFEYGVFDRFQIGTDLITLAFGIPTVQSKLRFWQSEKHVLALGIRAATFNLDSINSYANVKDSYDKLEANIIRPSISWTQAWSPRLKIHTFWAVRIGKINAELSEDGKRRSWEQKHPGEDYDARNPDGTPATGDEPEEATGEDADIDTEKNQEKAASDQSSNVTRRTLEVQSLLGLSSDRFQITGEFRRKSGAKVLVTCRLDRMQLEDLKSQSIRVSVAHQWIAESFQFRLGVGAEHMDIQGSDLDGEKVDEQGIGPVSEIAFYWRF